MQSGFSEVSITYPLYTYLHNLPWGNWISRGLWVAASTTERPMVPTITLLEIKAAMIVLHAHWLVNLIQPSQTDQ